MYTSKKKKSNYMNTFNTPTLPKETPKPRNVLVKHLMATAAACPWSSPPA